MSAPLLADDTIFWQRFLKCQELYGGAIDGVWGPMTEAGSDAFEQRSREIRDELGELDQRSERCIGTLTLAAQREARPFLRRLLDGGIRAKIISGTRSYEEQNALYQQGRSRGGRIVTNARGGFSNHNFGIAWDIGIFTESGAYVVEDGPYEQAAEVGLDDNLEWGGHWSHFRDVPHYQLNLGLPLGSLRAKFEGGEAIRMLA